MKGKPFVEPDEKHVLKAIAWDSLRTAYQFALETSANKREQDASKKFINIMA
jgi:hypothetical protein